MQRLTRPLRALVALARPLPAPVAPDPNEVPVRLEIIIPDQEPSAVRKYVLDPYADW